MVSALLKGSLEGDTPALKNGATSSGGHPGTAAAVANSLVYLRDRVRGRFRVSRLQRRHFFKAWRVQDLIRVCLENGSRSPRAAGHCPGFPPPAWSSLDSTPLELFFVRNLLSFSPCLIIVPVKMTVSVCLGCRQSGRWPLSKRQHLTALCRAVRTFRWVSHVT